MAKVALLLFLFLCPSPLALMMITYPILLSDCND